MANKWEQLGNDLMQSIGYAIETGDFSSLNQTVSDTIGRAVNNFTGTGNGSNWNSQYNQGSSNSNTYTGSNTYSGSNSYTGSNSYSGSNTYSQGSPNASNSGAYNANNTYNQTGRNPSNANRSSASGNRNSTSGAGRYSGAYSQNGQYAAGNTYRQVPSTKVYKSTLGAQVGGICMLVAGGCGALLFFMCLMVMLAMPWDIATTVVTSVIFLALTGGCVGVAAAGGSKLGLAKRFNNYVALLQNHEYYDVKQLAQQTGRSMKLVVKDLKKMIRGRWFKQGYLDASGNCLMVTDRAHRQYLELMDRTRQQNEENARRQRQAEQQEQARRQQEQQRRQQEEARKQQEEEKYANLSPEVRKIVETGDDYVKKIRALNDEIPGEEVSLKISRMELILDKIFDRVEQHPECADDVSRLLEYYLPMTMKLLEAYRDMDRQEIQPENVVSSKQEIENTLDTLNSAYEQLLNDLFQDTAWDLSSDISVLRTLLAQDGLTGQKLQ